MSVSVWVCECVCPLQTIGSMYFNVVYILGERRERREGERGGGPYLILV